MTSGESSEASRLPPPVPLHHWPDGQQEPTAGNGAGGQGGGQICRLTSEFVTALQSEKVLAW